jgi:hypothetical protein
MWEGEEEEDEGKGIKGRKSRGREGGKNRQGTICIHKRHEARDMKQGG